MLNDILLFEERYRIARLYYRKLSLLVSIFMPNLDNPDEYKKGVKLNLSIACGIAIYEFEQINSKRE